MDEILKNLENCKYEITEVKKRREDQKCSAPVYNQYTAAGSGQDSEFFHTENHASGTAVI